MTKQRIDKLSSYILINNEKLIKLANDASEVKLNIEILRKQKIKIKGFKGVREYEEWTMEWYGMKVHKKLEKKRRNIKKNCKIQYIIQRKWY